jgi:hypothetical protein
VAEVSDSESYGEDTSGRETTGGGRGRTEEMRTQAGLAWARVRSSVPRAGRPDLSIDGLMDSAARVPNESYVTGIAASIVTSAWLYALGRRTASIYFAIIPPLAFILGLYARYLRRRVK